ncbi:hypothetical protein KFK09_007708 [Dendrobium nobile]|uniref:Uncharacterized protein n=1 Tax=Dendrobium nobile TaxID=94219 RepID=A0A8T3BXB4_DENNO|nr:hypothetical protein KFK09_007708 [Dendrobium nobile]
MDEPMQQEQIAATDPNSKDLLLEVSNALPPPHPQQNLVKSIYNDKEHFLPPILSSELTGYPNMNARMGIGGLNQGGIGFPACYGGQGQGLFSNGILPMSSQRRS